MSDKPWGFFGATCEKWIQDDYQWESSMSEQLADGSLKITYLRNEDRIIGPEQLVFYVDIDFASRQRRQQARDRHRTNGRRRRMRSMVIDAPSLNLIGVAKSHDLTVPNLVMHD